MTLFWMHLRKDIKKMTKIIFATGNEGKMREIRDIMADLDVELLSMKEAGIKLDIVEDGKTFEERMHSLRQEQCLRRHLGQL